MRRTRKAINNLSLRKNIIRKAPIQSGIKHLCASRAQNDALEAILSHSAQAQRSGDHIEKFKAQRKSILSFYEVTCKLISCLWYHIPGHHTHREKFSGRKQRLRRSPAHSWTPTIPKMKKTKKQSSSTLPSMGRVSSRSVTRILIPTTQWKNNCSIISSLTRSKIHCCNNKNIKPQACCSRKTYEILTL